MASAEDSLKVSHKTFLPEEIELRLDSLIKPKGGRQGKKRKSDASAATRAATPARKKYKAAGANSGSLAKGGTAQTTPGSEKRKPGRPPKTKTIEAKKAESTSERRRSGRATTKVKYVESGPSSDEEEVAYADDDSGDEDVDMEDAGSEHDDAAKEKGSARRAGRKARPVEKEEEEEEGEKERSVSPTPGRKDKEATEPMDEDQEKEKENNEPEEEAAEPAKVLDEEKNEAEEEEAAKEVEPEEKPDRPPSPKPKITPMKRGRGRPKRQPPPEHSSPELPVVTRAKEKTPEKKATRGTRRTRATAGINGSATNGNGNGNGNGNAKAKAIATGDEDSSELSEPPSDVEVS